MQRPVLSSRGNWPRLAACAGMAGASGALVLWLFAYAPGPAGAHAGAALALGVLLYAGWRIAGAARRALTFGERAHLEARVARLAQLDVLTGLPNRQLFLDRLKHAMARARRNERLMALMFLDLDRFKEINDALGHGAGDALLGTVAGRLRAALREVDTVARLGGDEFTVILEDVRHVGEIAAVAGKLVEAVAQPVGLGGHEICVTASLGITLYPLDGEEAEDLLRAADAAMYQAKREGRNTFQFYSKQARTGSAARLAMQAQLRRALERGELRLHYQPQVDLRTGLVTGLEALARWRHPGLGDVPPAEFIPLAEETGVIVAIGNWAIRTACRQWAAWRAEGREPLTIAVNLSPRQFTQRDLVDVVEAALEEADMPARHLELEITEGLLMHATEDTVARLAALKALGVRLAVDDFGTGYSSLSYLKRFPIDRLKIDESFVRDLRDGENDAAIVRAIVSMSKSLRLAVVAEGVETEAQLGFLRRLGCDAYQGYLHSRPMPPEAAAHHLETA